MERERYIKIALSEHLNDTNTYKRISPREGQNILKRAVYKFKQLVIKSKKISKAEKKYLLLTFHLFKRNPQFYLLAKIHKDPMTTRPVISASGGPLFGLSKWLDFLLQKLLSQV